MGCNLCNKFIKHLIISLPWVNSLDQWFPTFLASGTSFMDDNFSMNSMVRRGGFEMITLR